MVEWQFKLRTWQCQQINVLSYIEDFDSFKKINTKLPVSDEASLSSRSAIDKIYEVNQGIKGVLAPPPLPPVLNWN